MIIVDSSWVETFAKSNAFIQLSLSNYRYPYSKGNNQIKEIFTPLPKLVPVIDNALCMLNYYIGSCCYYLKCYLVIMQSGTCFFSPTFKLPKQAQFSIVLKSESTIWLKIQLALFGSS